MAQTRPNAKRTAEQRERDTLRAYQMRIIGKTYAEIAEAISADGPYELSIATVQRDVVGFDPYAYCALLTTADTHAEASIWFNTLADWAIKEGINDLNTNMLRVAITAKTEAIRCDYRAENERIANMMSNVDPEKVTPEWRKALRKLMSQVEGTA